MSVFVGPCPGLLLFAGFLRRNANLAGGFASRCFGLLIFFCYVNGVAIDGPFGSFFTMIFHCLRHCKDRA